MNTKWMIIGLIVLISISMVNGQSNATNVTSMTPEIDSNPGFFILPENICYIWSGTNITHYACKMNDDPFTGLVLEAN
jgi:hypothetical protein